MMTCEKNTTEVIDVWKVKDEASSGASWNTTKENHLENGTDKKNQIYKICRRNVAKKT